jgi:hypothetical protein
MPILFFLALFYSQLTFSAVAFYYAGIIGAVLAFLGVGHLVAFTAPDKPVFLSISIWAAVFCFAILFRINLKRPIKYAVVTGVVPVVLYFAMSEIMVVSLMRAELKKIEEETCLYGARTFIDSALEVFEKSFLFVNPLDNHHAKVVLSGQRVMIWSYYEMTFVPHDYHSASDKQHLPGRDIAQECQYLFNQD